MARLDFRAFDADNHYYEAEDAFTRHVPEALQRRGVQWVQMGKHRHHLVAGKLAHAVKNPTWNPIAKPGAIADYLRGNPAGKNPKDLLGEREPLPREYIDHDARVAKLEAQGLEGIWLFPTLGVLYEELLKHDTEALMAVFRGFNRWLDEDIGLCGRASGREPSTMSWGRSTSIAALPTGCCSSQGSRSRPWSPAFQ